MDLRAEIVALLAAHGGRKPTTEEQADIVGRFGMNGDDLWEFLVGYAERFNVRLDGYRWYFHQFEEPPLSRRVFAVDPEGRSLPLMSISVDLLVEGVQTGAWPAKYPEHRKSNRWWATMEGRLLLGVGVILAMGIGHYVFG